jgi:hypothetical protein
MVGLLWWIAGCEPGDVEAFNDAQRAGTTEALETFVAQHPDSRMVPVAMVRLDDSHFEQAKKTNTIDAWNGYLAKHADGKHAPEAQYALEQLVYKEAEKAGTREALEKFIAEHPTGTFTPMAKKRLANLGDFSKIRLAPPVVEEVAMDERSNGPKDGWKVSSVVENASDKPVKKVVVRIQMMGPDGSAIDTREVAPVYPGIFYNGGEEAPDAWKMKLNPGEKRKFWWRTAKPPENWNHQVKLEVGDLETM